MITAQPRGVHKIGIRLLFAHYVHWKILMHLNVAMVQTAPKLHQDTAFTLMSL